MSERVGDRILIGILLLIACFAVFVTVSGQSSPTPKHGHCNPFDPDCDPDATFTSTATATHTPNAAATRLAVVLTAAAKLTSTAAAEKTAAAKLTATSVAKTATAAATQTAAAKTATAIARKTAAAAATQTAAAKTTTAIARETAAAAATQTAAAKTATAIAGIHTATPTPTPTPTPAPGQQDPMTTDENVSEVDWRHEDYRWIVVTWQYPADSTHTYVTADIDWSNDPQKGWNHLDTQHPQQPWGPRATVNHTATSADIRGIPLTDDLLLAGKRVKPFYMRVRGVTEDGKKSEWSQIREVQRTAYFYPAGGHQHDHSLVYSVGGLGSGVTDTIIADASRLAARIWTRATSFASVKVNVIPEKATKSPA